MSDVSFRHPMGSLNITNGKPFEMSHPGSTVAQHWLPRFRVCIGSCCPVAKHDPIHGKMSKPAFCFLEMMLLLLLGWFLSWWLNVLWLTPRMHLHSNQDRRRKKPQRMDKGEHWRRDGGTDDVDDPREREENDKKEAQISSTPCFLAITQNWIRIIG